MILTLPSWLSTIDLLLRLMIPCLVPTFTKHILIAALNHTGKLRQEARSQRGEDKLKQSNIFTEVKLRINHI